jgi:hypothetical protein
MEAWWECEVEERREGSGRERGERCGEGGWSGRRREWVGEE